MPQFREKADNGHLRRDLTLEIIVESETLAIPGLKYIPHYINVDEQNQLLDLIEQQPWSLESIESKRRIQQHGYRYVYENGILIAAIHLGLLPDWAETIARRLYDNGLAKTVFDQVTVNEYEPGQGLTSHVDCVTCFGNTIITLSFGSSYLMEFTHSQTQENREIMLLPGSLLILRGESRYIWQHSVSAREKDMYKGREFIRTRRVAMTFREALFLYK